MPNDGVLRDPPLNGDTSDNNNNDDGGDDDAMINKRKTEVEEINFNRFFCRYRKIYKYKQRLRARQRTTGLLNSKRIYFSSKCFVCY